VLNDKLVAVVVPAYNEETQIGMVLDAMPAFVDRIIVVNDHSTDKTAEAVLEKIASDKAKSISIALPRKAMQRTKYNEADVLLHQALRREQKLFTPYEIANENLENDRIILINLEENSGVGAAIARGYKWCLDRGIDCTAVMAGDGQMDPAELEKICAPVTQDGVDYVKGNRLIHRSAWLVVPRIRYAGNSILSIFNKIASGYWKISDTQCGYTAISLKALHAIRIHQIYPSYGMPNDMLVKMNVAYCTIREVEIKPVYRVGEKSKMNIIKVMPKIAWLLLRSFFKRLWVKYLFRDFHPLFLLYHYAIIAGLASLPYAWKVLRAGLFNYSLNFQTTLAFMFLSISAFQAIMFAMWMDIQDNERLYK